MLTAFYPNLLFTFTRGRWRCYIGDTWGIFRSNNCAISSFVLSCWMELHNKWICIISMRTANANHAVNLTKIWDLKSIINFARTTVYRSHVMSWFVRDYLTPNQPVFTARMSLLTSYLCSYKEVCRGREVRPRQYVVNKNRNRLICLQDRVCKIVTWTSCSLHLSRSFYENCPPPSPLGRRVV